VIRFCIRLIAFAGTFGTPDMGSVAVPLADPDGAVSRRESNPGVANLLHIGNCRPKPGMAECLGKPQLSDMEQA
jgi:hypothetical protein